ncbi:hypothetical protein FLCU109888_11600 [Flavobacterium cucumis]|uniref:Uncharacterized protein n=1 Tax=Flavobacterium cucumis TaxID=416016 RepID=A0A1M7ZVH9_9FLAO|nr:hypothetical protein [Flavobacterium cucumis]SHO72895.1 hypothetical protein SAMN05443547_1240 [Flavobacterium cucumis]
MLQYQPNESPMGSQFFIKTNTENIHLLRILKREIEQTDFDDEFLQANVYQLDIVNVVAGVKDNFCCNLPKTIKHIFDDFLFRTNNAIIYVSVENEKMKKKLLNRFIEEDNNDEFTFIFYELEDFSLYFFLNREKTNVIEALNAINEYMNKEYGIEAKF